MNSNLGAASSAGPNSTSSHAEPSSPTWIPTDPDTGEAMMGLYTGHLGVAVEVSTQVRLPARARPMIDGMEEGLEEVPSSAASRSRRRCAIALSSATSSSTSNCGVERGGGTDRRVAGRSRVHA